MMDTNENGAASKRRPLVLYVEDSSTNARLLERVFKGRIDADLKVHTTAEAGLAAAQTDVPDLIITDIKLPGMSGVGLLHAIGETPILKNIPVIALTASAMPQDVQAAETVGFYRYVTKPFVIDDLTALIREALAAPRG